jgi:hypothetical protein
MVDAGYQRTLERKESQSLIRRIAQNWDWGLCQPLFVARRCDGQLYVVDGQHRLAAARLRGDLWQLPCVVASFETPAEEAAAFVALNQQRRPLNRLDLFKAALSSGDFETSQIAVAVEESGLRIASSTNLETCGAGSISNVVGLQHCYRAFGLQVLTIALQLLSEAWPGQVLRYAGTIFPGLARIVADEIDLDSNFGEADRLLLMLEMLSGATQEEWYRDVMAARAADPSAARRLVVERVLQAAWSDCLEAMLDEAA